MNFYENIYNEMYQRNMKNFLEHGTRFTDWNDGKRCMAIVAAGEWVIQPFLQHFLTESDVYVNPVLHHTFLVVRPWVENDYVSDGSLSDLIIDIRECGLSRYTIYFDRLILTPTGLLMVGQPNKDINKWRDKLRDLQQDRGVTSGELYYNNIAHATIFRWTKELSPRQRFRVASIVEKINKNKSYFATFNVFGYEVMNASWLLKEPSVSSLFSEYLV